MRQRHDEGEHPLMTAAKWIVPRVILLVAAWMASMMIMLLMGA